MLLSFVPYIICLSSNAKDGLLVGHQALRIPLYRSVWSVCYIPHPSYVAGHPNTFYRGKLGNNKILHKQYYQINMVAPLIDSANNFDGLS